MRRNPQRVQRNVACRSSPAPPWVARRPRSVLSSVSRRSQQFFRSASGSPTSLWPARYLVVETRARLLLFGNFRNRLAMFRLSTMFKETHMRAARKALLSLIPLLLTAATLLVGSGPASAASLVQ